MVLRTRSAEELGEAASDLLWVLVERHRELGTPDNHSVVQQGDWSHIVPDEGPLAGGGALLDVVVELPRDGMTPSEIFDELLVKLSVESGFRVLPAYNAGFERQDPLALGRLQWVARELLAALVDSSMDLAKAPVLLCDPPNGVCGVIFQRLRGWWAKE